MSKNMEMDSEANIQYLICECGDNFPNEKSLREHFALKHTLQKKAAPREYRVNVDAVNEYLNVPPKKPTKTKFVQKPIYFITKNVVCEKIAIAPEDMMKSLEGHLEEHHAKEIMEDLVNMPVKVEAIEEQQEEEEEEDVSYEYQTIVTSDNRIMREHNYDKSVRIAEYYCDICGKSFDKEHAVELHIQMQHLYKKLSCEFCDAEFSRMHWLISHMASKHDIVVEKPAKQLLKKFVCSSCDGAFTSAASLKYHYRIHTGEKPYHCTICPKKFKMPLQLQIHIRTHTGEKPFSCELCAKAFGNRGALWRHNKVHTGEKPYECDQCQKRFSQSNSLKLHVRTVHMKLPAPYKSKARRMKQAQAHQEISSDHEDSYITYEDYHQN